VFLFLFCFSVCAFSCLFFFRSNSDWGTDVCASETEERVLVLTGHVGFVNSVAVTPDNKYVISSSYDYDVRVWNLETGDKVGVFRGHEGTVLDVVGLANSRAISASEDKTLKLWDLTTKKAIATFIGSSGFKRCAVAPDGRTIVAGDYFGRLHFLYLEG
ncbi:MAG: hypothetical protein F6K39_44070, partial [Okeania sp. SIO3B3]|nr:hypothetical protein [Okeania sp. SIO3B3]